jgi:hypothetical protein
MMMGMVLGRNLAVIEVDCQTGGHGVLGTQLDERNGGRATAYGVGGRSCPVQDFEPKSFRRR